METSNSKYKLRIIENELRYNWNEYKKLPLEEIRKKLKNRLRKQFQNQDEQLSHEEFYEIFMNIVGKKQDKKRKDEKKGKDDKNRCENEER